MKKQKVELSDLISFLFVLMLLAMIGLFAEKQSWRVLGLVGFLLLAMSGFIHIIKSIRNRS